MHDPAVYEDPDAFRPERFIRDGKLDPSVQDPGSFVFGFGRRCVGTRFHSRCRRGIDVNDFRICPGRHFAMASLFINVASVLHTLDITPALDADGRPVKIKYSQTSGFISCAPFPSLLISVDDILGRYRYPQDCRCTIKPRSSETAAMIAAHADAVA